MTETFAFLWWPAGLLWPFFFLFWKFAKDRQSVLKVPFFNELRNLEKLGRKAFPLALVIFSLLVLAAMRPVMKWQRQSFGQPAADVVILLDISGSMADTGKFQEIRRQTHDIVDKYNANFGVVAFATQPYVLSPVTADKRALHFLIDDIAPGIAGTRTNIADSVLIALAMLKNGGSVEQKAIVVLSDGDENTGVVSLDVAAGKAQTAGIPVFIGEYNQPEALASLQKIDFSDELFVWPLLGVLFILCLRRWRG